MYNYMIYVKQVKAGRALLGWTQTDLAEHSEVSLATIAKMELNDGLIAGNKVTKSAIRRAFENAGILFIDADDEAGIGVRLKQ